MGKVVDGLRKTGGPLTFVATMLQLAALNWMALVSGLLATAAVSLGWATDLVTSRPAQIVAGVFLAALWTLIGIRMLATRHRPIITRPEQDYAYGLTFSGVSPTFIPTNDAAALQFGLAFQNYSTGPIKYDVETFEVVIENRTLPKQKWTAPPSVMARGSSRMSRQRPFTKEAIKDLIGKPLKGTLTFAVVYGHPEKPPVRRLSMTIEMFMELREVVTPNGLGGSVGYADSITEESDTAI